MPRFIVAPATRKIRRGWKLYQGCKQKMATPPIELFKRARCYETDAAKFRRWDARAGDYSIAEVRSLLGLPRRFLLIAKRDLGEIVVSSHRTLGAAYNKYWSLQCDTRQLRKK